MGISTYLADVSYSGVDEHYLAKTRLGGEEKRVHCSLTLLGRGAGKVNVKKWCVWTR